jgi:hypothetical protein
MVMMTMMMTMVVMVMMRMRMRMVIEMMMMFMIMLMMMGRHAIFLAWCDDSHRHKQAPCHKQIPFACAPLGLKTVCGSICLAPVVGFMEMGEPMP